MRHDVGRLFHHLAVAPDAVARQVGADVQIDPERGDAGIADVGHADDGTGFRVELAKAVERGGQLLRQDGEIALYKTAGDAGRGRGHAGPTCQPRPHAREYLLPLAFAALLLLRQTDNHPKRSVARQGVSGSSTMQTSVMHPCVSTPGFSGRINDKDRIQSANRFRPPLGYDSRNLSLIHISEPTR